MRYRGFQPQMFPHQDLFAHSEIPVFFPHFSRAERQEPAMPHGSASPPSAPLGATWQAWKAC